MNVSVFADCKLCGTRIEATVKMPEDGSITPITSQKAILDQGSVRVSVEEVKEGRGAQTDNFWLCQGCKARLRAFLSSS